MDDHHQAVATIAENVRIFHQRKVPYRIYHGSTNSTRFVKRDPDKVIDTGALCHIIAINKDRKTAIVEANVAMDALVMETLKQGLVPAIVPEFPGITVGGSFSGLAAESSSFRYGFFDRIVNWVEIVLSDGTTIQASPTCNSDLFEGSAGALGTLGVATLFEIQLVACSTYVETTYILVRNAAHALSTLAQCRQDESIAYLDAILYSAHSGIVIAGRLKLSEISSITEQYPPVVRLTHPQDPWYCLHVHDKVRHACNTHCIVCLWNDKVNSITDSGAEPAMVELIPMFDYFFRYDRGSFWMGCYGWDTVPLPFNRIGRWLLDRAFRTRNMYKIMHHSGQAQRFIVQDLVVPEENAAKLLDYIEERLMIYPLWLCPVKGRSKAPLHTNAEYTSQYINGEAKGDGKPEHLMNIGLWGVPELGTKDYRSDNFHEFININRDVEKKVRNLHGLKVLYAHNYYTEDEFWQAYDKAKYDNLRRIYHAEGLPNMWDKVKRESQDWRPIHIGKAFLATIMGKDYMLKGKKK